MVVKKCGRVYYFFLSSRRIVFDVLSMSTIILQALISVRKGDELKNNTKTTYERARSLLDFIRGSMKDIEGWEVMIMSLNFSLKHYL